MRTETDKERGVALPYVYASWFLPEDASAVTPRNSF